MERDWRQVEVVVACVIAAVAFLAFVVGIPWFCASMEARAYNRVTGAEVTTWDAVWLDLRVQEDSHPD